MYHETAIISTHATTREDALGDAKNSVCSAHVQSFHSMKEKKSVVGNNFA